jgi:DegV family protein with EDD domain
VAIKIVTDTLGNLPQAIIDEYAITVIPVYVTFGDEILRDQVDLTSDTFYRRLAASDDLPSTSQPSVSDFERVYRALLEDAPDATVLSIHVSAALSGTFHSGREAVSRLPDANVHLFDSRTVSLPEGLMVYHAAQMAEGGMGVDMILKRLESMQAEVYGYLALDTLDYLARGGRIGRAARLTGTLLNMKPVLTLRGGAVEPYERYASRSRAIGALRDLAVEGGQGAARLQLGVMHAACAQDAHALADDLRKALEPEVLIVGDIGPAVGVHTGPGAIGVCWYAPPGDSPA